jgi:flagellin
MRLRRRSVRSPVRLPSAFVGQTAAAPVADPNSQATRASLVEQYNQVLQQINTTSQDSSFNGINLLNGDTLNLTFDETGASKLAITGYTFNDAGLGCRPDHGHRLPRQQLRQQGAGAVDPGQHHAAHGSVESRFEPVDRGDPPGLQQEPDQRAADRRVEPDAGRSNEEAANSQALSTRQSIAVSALALANQSQQSVLQLLR